MANPAFELIGLDALRLDPLFNQDARDENGRVIGANIDGDAPDVDGDGSPDRRMSVVVIDTGVDTEHQLLAPNVVAFVDFIDGTPVVTNSPPSITSGNFSSPENTTEIGNVTGTDPEGTALTFSIAGGADQNKLRIDSASGALSFVGNGPDFETPDDADGNNVYEVTVRVSDGQNTVDQDITVTVTDVEEIETNQAPEFTSPNEFSMVENNTAVGTVTATDPDGDALSYSITGGSDQNRLAIDANTGALSFISARDFENPRDAGRDNVYNVQVTVSDGVNSVTQDIAVTVTDDTNERILLTGVLRDNNDPDGHGTHVAGIIGATDPNIGVANKVDLIGLRVLGEGQDGSEVTQALQWVIDNRSEYGIVAVNMSLGIPSAFYTQRPDESDQADPIYSTWRRLIQELEEAGVTVVSAAGNNYAENNTSANLRENISVPAIASTAAVGAVWQDGTVTNARWRGSRDRTTGADRLVSFSQRLSSYGGMLFAPGAVIESTLPGNQTGGLAGTSMAAPMVSGVVALMQDAAISFGDRLLTPDEIRNILLQTAEVIVDGDDEDTDVTASGANYLRIDAYSAVRRVYDEVIPELPPVPGDKQFFRFTFNSGLQTEDFYEGYGYAEASTYTVGQTVTVDGGTYTITDVIGEQEGTAGEVVVTDYYDGSTNFGYAIYVDAVGSAGLGSESGNAYDGNFGGPDTSFSSADTADLQAPPTRLQLYYFTYYYGDGSNDFYEGYGYVTVGTGEEDFAGYTAGQRIDQASPNETGSTGYYEIDQVFDGNYGDPDAVVVYSYYDGTDGNGEEPGGAYGPATYVWGEGYEGLGSESGYAYDYNYVTADAEAEFGNFDGVIKEANLARDTNVVETVTQYYFTYYYNNGDNGDYYQGYGYTGTENYTQGQRIDQTEPNETGNVGYYIIDQVYENSYGLDGEVVVNIYYDGVDGNGDEPGGAYGFAYDVWGSGYGGLGSESGYAYGYDYLSEDVYFSNVDEANLISRTAGSQLYYFTYYYGDGSADYYQGYGYAAAGTYTADQEILSSELGLDLNELGLDGRYVIDAVYDVNYSYYIDNEVYVTTYYDGSDGNGADPGGEYGFAFDAWGYGFEGLGSEAGYAYDNNYLSTDVDFSNFNEANLVNQGGPNQLYYFRYDYGNGDYYQGYGYAAADTYTVGQAIIGENANETGEIGGYTITAIYGDEYGYLDSVYVTEYYDADTGYGFAFDVYGDGYEGLGSETGYAYDVNYLSTDVYFSNFDEADLTIVGGDNQLYYFTYYYGDGDGFDYYEGYGYAAAGTYTADQRLDQTDPNETGGTGYYVIGDVYDVSYGVAGQVSVYSYNDVDTGYGFAYDVWAEGYGGLGSEYGDAYDYYYSSVDSFFSNQYEADLSTASTPADLYYFTYYYGEGESFDYYQGYGYAPAGTYTEGQRIDQTDPNETGGTGYYVIDSIYADSYYAEASSVYVYNYFDADTGYGWAYDAWGEGYDGLGSESGFAWDYEYISSDPEFSTYYEADLLESYGTDINPTLATATNLGAIPARALSLLPDPDTSSFVLGSDPNSGGPVPKDVDMYRFELASPGTVSIETSLPAGATESMDTILRLFDTYGNELGVDDDTGPNFYSRINAYLETGTYYFGVSGYDNFNYSPTSANSGIPGSTGDYAISIGFEETPPFVGDPNGTAAGARDIGALSNFATFGGADVPSIIGLDTDTQGVDPTPENLIAVGDKDVDLIQFTAAPGLVIFQTSDYVPDYVREFGEERGRAYLDLLDSDRDGHFDDSIDTVLRLFDASGNELAMDDDGGEGLLSRLEYLFTAEALTDPETGEVLTNPDTGEVVFPTYYLGVSGYGNEDYDINTLPENVGTDASRSPGSTGASLLSLILQPTFDPDPEDPENPDLLPQDPNGVFYGAIPVELIYGSNLSLTEQIGSDVLAGETINVTSGDVDLYRFTADETGVVLVDLDTVSGSPLNTYVRVFSEDGVALPDYSNDDSSARDFNRNAVAEDGNSATDSFVRLDVTAGNTYFIGVSASGNQTYNLNDLTNRTNPSTGDYQINLQYGGGETGDDNVLVTDADGYIHADLPSFDLSASATGNGNRNTLRRNIGSDEIFGLGQAEIGLTDVDFVRVYFESTETTPRILTATAENNNNSGRNVVPTVYVFDVNGDEIAASTAASGANSVQLALDPNTDYYVAVAGYGNEGFNPLIMSSGRDATGTGGYTLDLSLSGTDRTVLTGILNAANQRGTLFGNSLDFDIDLFGADTTTTPAVYGLSASQSHTIEANLGEDIDKLNATSLEKNAFGRMYIEAQGLTGTAAQVDAISSDVGADDVDIYPINVTEAGDYQFTTTGTGNAIDDARPTLKLYDSTGAEVTLTTYRPRGLVTGNVLAQGLAAGDYSLVIMSTGSGTDQFEFGSDPGFTTALTEAQLREFYQNTGNYSLTMESAALASSAAALDGSSVSRVFSLPLDVADLQMYGASGVTPSVSVTGPDGNAVAGSLVFDEDFNELRFVPTNPVLAAGTYTINYDSEDFHISGTDTGNMILSEETFTVSASNPIIYLPSFARGPGQSVDIGGTGIPVKISNTEGLTVLTINVDYDPDALNITGAQLADGLTGWEIVGEPTIGNGRISVIVRDILDDGSSNPLPAGDREVIRLIADVPANAVFNSAEVLEVSGGALAGSRRVTLADSTAVQKVVFFGDVGGTPDGIVDFGDVLSAALKFLEDRSGFDAYDLTDPNLIGDVNSDGNIDFGDVLAMAQKFLNGSSPLIPDADPLPGSIAELIDPVVSVSNVQAQPGERANVVISLDSTEGAIQSFNFTVRYDTTKLDIDPGDITLSSDITGLGFSQVAPPTVDEAAGLIRYGAINFAGTIDVGSAPDLVNLNFLVLDTANVGDSVTIDMSDTTAETGFFGTAANRLVPLTVNDGTITIAIPDTTAPTLEITDDVTGTLNLATGAVTYTFTFSEPVKDFDAADITVTGGTAGDFSTTSTSVYTLVVTPDANAQGNIALTVSPDGFTDLADIPMAAAVEAAVQPFDTQAPTVAINVDGTASGPFTFTFTFSEDVTGFDATDITVAGGTTGTFTATSASVYTLVVTPPADATGTITVDVAAGAAADGAGNPSVVAAQATQPFNTQDTTPPSVTPDQTFSYGENQAVDFAVGTVAAEDNVGVTTFAIASGNDGGLFAISNAGVITLTAAGVASAANDFETAPNTFTLGITASDALGNTSTATNVIIDVTDVDEFDVTTPGDTNDGANTIAENAANGVEVGITANATDADGSNNTVTYSLTDNAGGRFAIAADTGVVTVADGSLLDFETATTHNITVQAASSDGSTSTETFTIAVTDVNEPPTAVVLTNTVTTLAEDADTTARIKVADITITDDALGTNPISLSGADAALFEVDGTELFLVAGAALDFETNPQLDVTVAVDDTTVGNTPDATTPLAIAITDVSENFVSITETTNGLYEVGLPDGSQTQLKFDGAPFQQGTFGNWQAIEAETVNDINQVLWQNPDLNQIGIWNADANWNWIFSDTFAPESIDTLNAEVNFQIDINGDGRFGDNLVSIENVGAIELLQGIFDFYHVGTADGLTSPIKFQGQPFENNFGNWQALAADVIDGANQVLWENLDTNEIGVWNTIGNWNWLSSDVFAAGSEEALAQLAIFGVNPS